MSHEQVIVEVVRSVERRRRWARGLREAATAVLAFPVPALGASLVARWAGVPGTRLWELLPWLGFGVAVAYLAWRLGRVGSPADAAAAVDRRAGLGDELASAYWFVSRGVSSPWVDHHVARAAGTARRLEVRDLFPVGVPRRLYVAGVALAVVALGSITLPPAPSGTARAAAVTVADDEIGGEVARVEALLDEAEEVDPEAISEEEPEARPRPELSEILAALEEGRISSAEAQDRLERLGRELESGNLDAGNLREALERLGGELEEVGAFEEVAGALQGEELRRAARLLRETAARLAADGIPAEELEAMARGLEETSADRSERMDDLLEELRKAGERGSSDPDAARRALESAAQTLESMDRSLRAQRLRGQAAERLGELSRRLGDRAGSGDSSRLLGARTRQGSAASAMGRSGEDVKLQAMGGSRPGEDPPEGGSLGHASGPGAGASERRGDPTRTDVELNREVAIARDDEDEEPGEIVEEETREQPSRLDHTGRPGADRYAPGGAIGRPPVPRRLRQRVREYFTIIREPLPSRSDETGDASGASSSG